MSGPALIQLKDVEKRFDQRFAIRVEAFEARAGERLCVLGPTGSGKSTLLRLACGLEDADRGEVLFAGNRLTEKTESLGSRRRIAFVFQRPALMSGTVGMNVDYGLQLRGVRDTTARVDSILQRLGLSEVASQSAGTLSGGQLQLVALARAMVVEPDVLVLDEPTASLDPANVSLVEETLMEEHRRRGMVIILATHNLFQARRLAERVVFMLDGRIIEAAAADDFFSAPQSTRAAEFVQGKMVY